MKLAPFAALAALLATPLAAQEAPPPPPAPKLIVFISVDQFSADLFAEYRNHWTGGFARLLQGAVFPSGYQSHAATETCPGHSTLLTGDHPSRTGIIANDWVDLKTAREDKTVYCAEDESVPGSNSSAYTVSDKHLRVPTLGERMKAVNPESRVVSVAGKDRAAVMMGGHKVDELWWWNGKAYVSYAGRTEPAAVTRANAAVAKQIATEQPPLDLPDFCRPHDHAVAIGAGKTVGTGHFARAAGNASAFRASPEFDGATLALAAALIQDMKLGRGSAPDIISIGASATDYVGHTYGTEGAEMCLQLASLDRDLGDFFAMLDATGVDYVVGLSADHGGHDLPERNREDAAPTAQRLDPALSTKAVNQIVATRLGLSGQLLWGGPAGDVWIDPKLPKAQHDRVLAETVKTIAAYPQVQAVFTAAQIAATPRPHTPPETWTLLERARESYDPERSGDLVVALKPRVTPIPDPTKGYVATHGSFWDYDRRVPMLFWRKGMTGFEQPLSVETVDIAPTLGALVGVRFAPGDVDGRCLDLVAGPATSCPN
ncbi:alkaline phosphatase family protein [Sphingomonas cannabina]|uniref:alkaline phosphatase family protein n=1 Tax=Sphingomonas cannabina TaxID=2899123 RepID=UPI001F3722BE|nr:alkaline phosphatase family protein [Sphingomonas cannabina]UIJ44989.1 alkaline phosphatase family protein [Sphingomonas cannabina]